MNPLQIEIMLHYYYSTVDYRDLAVSAISDALDELAEARMLENDRTDENLYCITSKGMFYVEYLCTIPLPTTGFRIDLPKEKP